QLTRGLRGGVIAERGDADRAVVPSVCVTGDDVVAALPTGPDVAELVDDVVVANVAPAARDRVVVVDGADRCRDVVPAVIRDRVVDDELLHLLVARRPVHEAFVRGPLLAREDPRGAGGRGLRVGAREVGKGAGDVVE